MTGERWFFDTNVLVYLFDGKDPIKQRIAGQLWNAACRGMVPLISTQVLQEFFITTTRAVKVGLAVPEARQALLEFGAAAEVIAVQVEQVLSATQRVGSSGFSFWDSLIIETAIVGGAQRLWTEDLQHGQRIASLAITNPFRVLEGIDGDLSAAEIVDLVRS